jgi:hypothetical protein
MVRHAVAATQHLTKIKILSGPAMHCETPGCRRKAAYLFRTGDGPIEALCEIHAGEAASRIGMPLPDSMVRVLQMGFAR